MAHFYTFNEVATAGAAEAEITTAATRVTIAAGHRAVVRRVEGFVSEAGASYIYLCNGALGAANHLYGVARTGIGHLGGDCFVFIDARAAAVTLWLSRIKTAAGAAYAGASMSGMSI